MSKFQILLSGICDDTQEVVTRVTDLGHQPDKECLDDAVAVEMIAFAEAGHSINVCLMLNQ